MSDPIAEAAASLSDAAPSSTESQAVSVGIENKPSLDSAPVTTLAPAPEVTPAGEPSSSPSSGEAGSGEAGNVDAGTPPAGVATPASMGNVLANAAPVVDAPVIDAPAAEPVAEVAELPRESHLMLLEAKISVFRAKLANAERVALDEFEAIVGHIKAVL
ncbi:hypothetical protein PQQ88_01230 [Paraburkholderia caledonica]|uniref:hypothetical protein n=1 Tax=Paraburkholderia caledonica TaxID=134536 RepID=UPI0038B9F0E4